jgi:cytochrome c553
MKITRNSSLALFAGPVVASVLAALFIFAVVSIANSAVAQLMGMAVAGADKYAMCSACHGAQGEGGIGPKLAGQQPNDIAEKLTAYVNKEEVGPQSQMMWGVSATLTPDDINNLAAYIATLK